MKPECTTYSNGDKYWRISNGQYHREDGPAVETTTGTKYWYRYDVLHRDDGPAIEWLDGSGNTAYYINGKRIHQLQNKHIYGKEKLDKYLLLI